MFRKYTDENTYSRIVNFDSVANMWEAKVKEFSSCTAIVDNDKTYTFKCLDEDVGRFRTVLYNNGVLKGDRVGILSSNSIDFVKSYLAIVTMGAVAVLLPPHLDETKVFGCSLKFSLKALVYEKDLEEKLGFMKEKNPAVKTILIQTDTDIYTSSDLSVLPADDCAVLFTGGTTGSSKGALLSHRAMIAGTKNGCYGVKEVFSQRYFLVLPLTHVFGLIRNLMTSLYTGSTLYICRNTKNMFREIAAFRPTIMVLVPALAEMALNLSKQFGKNMLGEDMKTIICGAAFVPPYLIREYAKMGITLYPGYGLTESANLVSGNPEPFNKPESVGLPYEGQQLKIVDGELWLKGENMMTGYIGEDNSLSYCDGWFKTGDLVRMDDDGFLYITGRIKEVIVLPNGENISPAEIENRFSECEFVKDCLVYEKIEDSGSILVLEVLPRDIELAKIDGEDKNAFLMKKLNEINASLPAFSRVSRIVIRDKDFKRSPSMKILRNGQ